MDAAKPNQKALLPLVNDLTLDRKTTLKASIEKVAAQYGVKSSTLICTHYQNSRKGPQHGNRLFTNKEEDAMV